MVAKYCHRDDLVFFDLLGACKTMRIMHAWLIHITAVDKHHLFQLRLQLTQLRHRAKANLRGSSVPEADFLKLLPAKQLGAGQENK